MLKMVKDFTLSSIKELDYINESENQTYFRNTLNHFPIKIPEIYYASEKILVSEWIEGRNLTELNEKEIQGEALSRSSEERSDEDLRLISFKSSLHSERSSHCLAFAIDFRSTRRFARRS